MGKIARLRIFAGNLREGFAFVELVIIDTVTKSESSIYRSLPPATEIYELLDKFGTIQTQWRKKYRGWREINSPDQILTNQALDSVKVLQPALDEWLENESFQSIREAFRANVNQLERLIIETDDINLQRLPWNQWQLLKKSNNSEIEVALHSSSPPSKTKLQKPVKILLILGSDENINLEVDQKFIENLPGAYTKTLHQPSKENLYKALESNSWDILFFAGHSCTEADGSDAKIIINNQEDFVTIESLSSHLKAAVRQGLKIAMFNSCFGLGIPRKLAELSIFIPYVIVMREPIHDQLAHEFLAKFLRFFIKERNSLQQAFQKARLYLIKFKDNSPNADYLPVVFYNYQESSLFYPKLTWLDYWKVEFRLIFNHIINILKKQRRSTQIILFIIFMSLGLLILSVTHGIMNQKLVITCPTTSANLSCGEKNNFINYPLGNPSIETVARIKFSEKKYQKAIDLFKKAWKSEKDPSTLIALNNVQVMQEIQENVIAENQVFYIGAVIPFNNTPEFIGRSMLSGIADQQNKVNNTNRKLNKTWRVIIVMANDNHDKNEAKRIASELGKMSNILGVVGSYSSHVTYNIIDDYQKEKLSLISPTATFSLENLEKLNPPLTMPNISYFFRPVPTTQTGAEKIVNYLEEQGYKQVIIFRNDEKLFGGSFYLDLIRDLNKSSLKIIKQFPLVKGSKSDIAEKVEKLKEDYGHEAEKTALIILPDAFTDRHERENKIEVIKINNGKFLIVGSNTVSDPEVLKLADNNKISKQALEKMIVSVPWFPSDKQITEFQETWGNDEDVKLIWYTAFSYDATQMLIEALSRQVEQRTAVTREGTRKILASKDFETNGLTGKIRLNGSDRQEKANTEQLSQLIIPDCSSYPCKWSKLKFYN